METQKPQRRWQVYAVAGLIVFATLMGVSHLFGDSKPSAVAKNSERKEILNVSKAEVQVDAPVLSLEDAAPPVHGTLASGGAEETTVSEEEVVEAEITVAALPTAPVGPPAPIVEQSAEQQADDVEIAGQVVGAFYENLDKGDVASAYDKLSPDFRECLSYDRFADGYSHTESLTCQIKYGEKLGPNRVRLDVAIAVTEMGVPVEYLATCVVYKYGDNWQLAGVAQLKT